MDKSQRSTLQLRHDSFGIINERVRGTVGWSFCGARSWTRVFGRVTRETRAQSKRAGGSHREYASFVKEENYKIPTYTSFFLA